ncbi:MAG: DNA-binding domain-containing protein [Pseudomonadota bacterium]
MSARLADLEDRFAAALSDPAGEAEDFLSLLSPSLPGLTPAERLDIYRANVMGALSRALENSFPVCRRILGDACFGAEARRYIRDHPSTDHDLSRYGDGFADLLRHEAHRRAEWAELAYLGDLADLEWRRHRAWFAEDDPGFDFDAFGAAAQQNAANLTLRLSASLGLLESPFPVSEIWSENQKEHPAASVSAAQSRRHLVVWRQGTDVYHAPLDPGSFEFLRDVASGASLDQLASPAEHRGYDLQQALPDMIGRGFVVGFVPGDSAVSDR